MLAPLLSVALSLLAVTDAGTPNVAPVTSTTRAPSTPTAGSATKPVDVTQLPFTPEAITQVVVAHQPEIQACYEKMLAAGKETLQGRLMTNFTITAAGSVTGAKVVKHGTTLHDQTLNGCVVGVLGKLTFPKPPNGKAYPVEYPFNLKAIE